ncbi:hypothetical protein [Nostoc sp. UHCC 0251]|uniref:hypothetical protein n=1 Tax=Nostoc sp. UHCC 0251 TaxID=3110240 RepID=UPI002B1F3D3D|nr:hypothetical protein [Nostoc sp. UHCC 0251]
MGSQSVGRVSRLDTPAGKQATRSIFDKRTNWRGFCRRRGKTPYLKDQAGTE